MTNQAARRRVSAALGTAVLAGVGLMGLSLSGCDRASAPSFKGIDITGADYARELSLADPDGRRRSLAEFKGRVVFISNLSSDSMDQAIITRSMAVDLTMTTKQKVERMRHIVSEADFLPEYSKQEKADALDLIDSLQEDVKELSLRTLIQTTKIRKSSGAKWKDLAEYTICG